MIFELTWFEPDDGRKYEGPFGGDLPAKENFRVDCVECWYSKLKVYPQDNVRDLLAERIGAADEKIWLPCVDLDQLEWHEVIAVVYRGANETSLRAVLGAGYVLTMYGAQQRPTVLEAKLGPRKQQEQQDE